MDNICVLFPYELSWGKNKPMATVRRIEWLFENFKRNVTIIEPYIRKEYSSVSISYANHIGLPERYKIISTGKYLSSRKAQFVCIPSILGILRKIKPSVIWSIKAIPISTIPAWIYSTFNPCIWIADCDDWEGRGGVASNYSPIYRYYDIFERFIYSRVQIVTVSSQALKKRINDLSPSAKAIYIPNGPTKKMLKFLNPNGVHPTKREMGFDDEVPIILYVGNIYKDAISDIIILTEVAKRLEDVTATWIIVGGGNCLNQAVDYVKQKNLQDKFLFTGAKSWPEVVNYLKIADIVVYFREDNPIQRARSPIKLLEYMAAGKAIIASKVGESSQMIKNDVTGILVPPNDINAASRAILLLIRDKALCMKFGQASRRAAEKMNLNNRVLSFLERITP